MNTTLSPLSQILSKFNIDLSQVKRIVFVSSIAGSMASAPILSLIIPISVDELRTIIEGNIEGKEVLNYIGHAPTVSLLNKLLNLNLQPTRAEYRISPNDLIIMVSLSQRQIVSGQDVLVSDFSQLVIRIVKVIQVIS